MTVLDEEVQRFYAIAALRVGTRVCDEAGRSGVLVKRGGQQWTTRHISPLVRWDGQLPAMPVPWERVKLPTVLATFLCSVKMQKVEGLEPSKIIDVLLSKVEHRGEERRRFGDVIADDAIGAADLLDTNVSVGFRLREGFPQGGIDGAVVRAMSIMRMTAEALVGIAPPVTHVAVTAE